MYSLAPVATGIVQRMPVALILHLQKEVRNVHRTSIPIFATLELGADQRGPWISLEKIGQFSAGWNLSTKMVPQDGGFGWWDICALQKKFPATKAWQGIAITSAGSQCIANQANYAGIPAQDLQNLQSWNCPSGSSPKS